ncbi:MAG: M48 family metalloprotease [Sedimentisphaerales bacterium]|nr:M48 family metalloprotease [Sedimentisphaerales bacterium]
MLNRGIMLVLAGTLALSAGCHVNPATGDEELMFFSADQDVSLGRKYAAPVEKELGGRIPDENLQGYINDVGQRIARVCDQPDISYHFTAVEERMVNALALPGGYIFVTRGLLKEMKSEGQLAAVLAHEVGHVVARDTMAALSRQLSMTALVAAAAVSGAPGRAVAAADFVSAMLSLQYSRDDERDADLTGLSYMTHAGYDPNGIVEAMQILDELQTIRPIEFFSTHPNPESRITYLQERIADRYSGLGPLKEGQQEYEEAVLSRLKKHTSRETVSPNSAVKP